MFYVKPDLNSLDGHYALSVVCSLFLFFFLVVFLCVFHVTHNMYMY